MIIRISIRGFPGGTAVKNPPANAGDARDADSIPGSRRSPGEGNGNPLQHFCLENSMDRGAWRATVAGVAKSWAQLSTQANKLKHFRELLSFVQKKKVHLFHDPTISFLCGDQR